MLKVLVEFLSPKTSITRRILKVTNTEFMLTHTNTAEKKQL